MTNWNASEHPRAGQVGVPGNAGGFACKKQASDAIELQLTGTADAATAENPFAIATGRQGAQIHMRVRQGLRPNTSTWRPSDDLSGVRFRGGGADDELYLKSELVFAPQRSGGTWTISRQSIVDEVDRGQTNDEYNSGPFGAQMFDALVARGALRPVADEDRARVGADYEAGRRAIGDGSTVEQMQQKVDSLYEMDPAAIISIYPELTRNGDAWHDYAVEHDLETWR